MARTALTHISTQQLQDLLGHIVLDDKSQLMDSGLLSPIMVREQTAYGTLSLGRFELEALEKVHAQIVNALLTHPDIEKVMLSLTDERAPEVKTAFAQSPSGIAASQHTTGNDDTPSGAHHIKKMIAVGSGKGGVGKSTTAFNLAIAMAEEGLEVGLLDADLYGPSVPTLAGVHQPDIPARGQNFDPPTAHGIKVMSVGFLIDPEEPVAWRGPMVTNALLQMVHQVNWGALDVLLIDLPPGTGDIQLTLAQRLPLAGAVIVCTPQDLALIDAKKAISLFHKVSVPILGIVENMSLFTCPACGHKSAIFGHGGARQKADALGIPLLAEVPLTMGLRQASDKGEPIKMYDKDLVRIFARLAHATLERAVYLRKESPKIVIEN